MFIEKLSDTEVLFLAKSVLEQVVPNVSELDDFFSSKVERNLDEGNVVVKFKYNKCHKSIKLTDYEVKIACPLKPSTIKSLNEHCAKFLYKKFGDWYLDSFKNNQIKNLNKIITKKQLKNKCEIEYIKR